MSRDGGADVSKVNSARVRASLDIAKVVCWQSACSLKRGRQAVLGKTAHGRIRQGYEDALPKADVTRSGRNPEGTQRSRHMFAKEASRAC